MNPDLARLILTFRCHFGCSFSKIGLLFESAFGGALGETFDITETTCRQRTGQIIVKWAERVLGLKPTESDEMEMYEGICQKCRGTAMYLSYTHDVPKQCRYCMEMAGLMPTRESA